MHRASLSILLASLFANPFAIQTVAAPLTLQDYLQQVKTQSPGYQASQSTVEGSEQSARDGELQYIPKLSLSASHLNDRREVAGFFQGSKTIADNFSLGIEKQFEFGLKSKLSYTLLSNNQFNLPATIPGGAFKFVQGNTQLDLEQPLWKNFFGKETRALSDRDEATSLQTHFLERLNSKRILAQAESAYFRLAIARESVRLQQEVLDRSKKILDWSTKRVKSNLADKSDMLQARAAYQLRQIELENNKNELRAAGLAFNILRNSSQEVVSDDLASIDTRQILTLKAPPRSEKTDDVAAAEQAERLATANQETQLQKTQPELVLFSTLAVNGVDNYLSPALAQSLTTANPMYMVGVRFSMPLYFWETSEIRAGRVKQQLAAESNTRQKRLESDQTWTDLNQKLIEAKERLKMADELVQAQKEKLDHEKTRFNLGRTTTYQVLTFEQDYASALIIRLKIEQEIISTYAQLKVFAESDPT
jgi:outer membrane protein TolC